MDLIGVEEKVPTKCRITGATKNFSTIYQGSMDGLNDLLHTADPCDQPPQSGSLLRAVWIPPQPTVQNDLLRRNLRGPAHSSMHNITVKILANFSSLIKLCLADWFCLKA